MIETLLSNESIARAMHMDNTLDLILFLLVSVCVSLLMCLIPGIFCDIVDK